MPQKPQKLYSNSSGPFCKGHHWGVSSEVMDSKWPRLRVSTDLHLQNLRDMVAHIAHTPLEDLQLRDFSVRLWGGGGGGLCVCG